MEQYNRPNIIRAMVVTATLFIVLSVAPSRVTGQDIGVITYREGTQPRRIYAFVRRANGNLYVHYRKDGKWRWADQGKPPAVGTVSSGPGVITYRDGNQPQRIYAFVQGSDGKLWVNYWKGSRWQWTNQGPGQNATVTTIPGVITYRDGNQPQRIYTFVKSSITNKLWVNYWNGSQWKWADQGTPGGVQPPFTGPSAEMVGNPGVITYREGTQPRRIYAFVRGRPLGATKSILFVRYWNGSLWQWAVQGTPQGVSALEGTPGVITYRESNQPQRIYAFVRGTNGNLYVNYRDGSQWKWADQGTPPGTTVSGSPGVITYRDGTQPQRIYAFVRGTNGNLYVNYWDGSQWIWADQGTPPGTTVSGSPGAISYQQSFAPRVIYVFVQGANGKLYINRWTGSRWIWDDQGAP